MIAIRNASEIAAIAAAGDITGYALETVRRAIRPGITTLALDHIATEAILSRGGEPAFRGYRGYPATICASINEVVVHGIPSERSLTDGDIVSIDVGVRYRGYCADAARTMPVGSIDESSRRLLAVTEEALARGLAAAAPGKRLSDISHAIQEHVETNGFSIVRAFVGHGIGTKIHEEPEIPNYGRPGTGPHLAAGMALAIEPMVNAGTYDVRILKDGWTAVTKDGSRSAHFEHTVIVTETGVDIVTAAAG